MSRLMDGLPNQQCCKLRNNGDDQTRPIGDQRPNDQRQYRKIADNHIKKRRPASGLGEMFSKLPVLGKR